MSVEQNKETLRRMYEEVYNKGNLSLAPELVAPGYHFGDLRGPDGWKQAVTSWRTAFPDIHFTVEDAVGEGDGIAYRLSMEGTFKGKWRGIEPTGKKVKGTLAFFSQYENGKLLTSFAFADQLAMYQQMGVTPPGSAEAQEANKAVTRRTLEEVMNKGDVALIPDLFASTYVHRGPGGQEIKGHDGWKQAVLTAHAAFPDVHYTVDELVAEGEKVVCRYSMSGTHRGEYMGIAANGKPVSSKGVFVNRFENGKVAETFGVSNPLLFFQQLGVRPPAVAQGEEANKAVVRRTLEEIWNKGNLSLIPEQIWPDYVSHSSNGQDSTGYEGFRNMVAATRTPFPDVHFQIDQMVAEGDRVVCNCTMTGTHLGSIMGIAPTGKKFNVKQSYTTLIRGGKSVESWSIVDGVSLFRQLGIAPPSPADANKTAIRRTMEEIWNKGDLSKVPELVAPDYVGHQAVGDVRGQEGFSSMIASARAATPDLHCKIEDLVVEGDKVVCHYTVTGTDTKGMGGAAPTGKQVSVKAMFLTRMKDGKSAETWPISDRLGMYQQLGITPPTK
jgi:steroid delta-isomerase-like uncharacterized protein